MIRLANYGLHTYNGWVRTTIDKLPPHTSGPRHVVGRKIGSSTWAVDVKVENLPAGKFLDIDLDTEPFAPFQLGANPANGDEFFGGVPSINGIPFQHENVVVDGSAYTMRMHCRVDRLMHVRMWVTWRPSEPWMMRAECVVTCSNPSVPDIVAAPPPLIFQWGDALVNVLGRGWTKTLVENSTFADGQARAFPLTLIWLRHLPQEFFETTLAVVTDSIAAVGLTQLLPGGNPRLPLGFSAGQWTRDRYPEAVRRLHTWEEPLCGPSKRSADTGAQEDQVFVRGECFARDGVGAEKVAYLSALKLFGRPCHHLEADGRIADPIDHPNAEFWYGRPHAALPDRLGKTASPSLELTHGWEGPDREHWLYNTLAAAARLTGSFALQWELEHQARLFLFSETLPSLQPTWFTSGADAARSIGWAGILAVHLWHCLEDRALAQRVADRWVSRVKEVYIPQLWNKSFNIWDKRMDDPRLGAGAWWIPWQQAVGAYGLDLACAEIGPLEGREIALKGAKVVLENAWVFGPRWTSKAQMPVIGGTFPLPDESFNYFGMPLAVAVVLKHEPTNERAQAVWKQLLTSEARSNDLAWLPPEIPSN